MTCSLSSLRARSAWLPFYASEKWSEDASIDIAQSRAGAAISKATTFHFLQGFVDRYHVVSAHDSK